MHYDDKRDLYIYRLTVGRNDSGQPVRKSFSGKTQEIVIEKVSEWERRGSFVSLDPDIAMKEWAEMWFAEYSQKIEESTASTYKYTLAHIVKTFGHKKVSAMRAVDIERYLGEMATQYSTSQCGKLRTMLNQILRKAEANELITKNPVPLADRTNYRRMGQKRKKKKDAYTADEVTALMKGLQDTRIGHSIRLMLGTGISMQELLGLSSFDITQDGSRISVRRTVKLKDGSKMYIGEVKAENRERDVAVPPSVQSSARFLRENASGFVLSGKGENMPLQPTTYRKFYRSAINQIENVRVLTPHCCRHTYINAHTDFAVIQALSGQSTQSATISYIHPQSPSVTAAVGTIEALLTGKKMPLAHNRKSEK